MHEADLHFFIDSTVNYFEEKTGTKAIPGIPFLKGEEPAMLEYTSIIGISGERKGVVYLTASKSMLEVLAETVFKVREASIPTLEMLIGEVTNNIALSVRAAYGSQFMISLPVVVQGKARGIQLPDEVPAFVVPLDWQKYRFYLVVSLD